ncbi:hypothetical protein L204_106041 [Cryptococcus depauperatus]
MSLNDVTKVSFSLIAVRANPSVDGPEPQWWEPVVGESLDCYQAFNELNRVDPNRSPEGAVGHQSFAQINYLSLMEDDGLFNAKQENTDGGIGTRVYPLQEELWCEALRAGYGYSTYLYDISVGVVDFVGKDHAGKAN